MEHAPTIGALCGGRLAKAKGVRYGPPSHTVTDRSLLARAAGRGQSSVPIIIAIGRQQLAHGSPWRARGGWSARGSAAVPQRTNNVRPRRTWPQGRERAVDARHDGLWPQLLHVLRARCLDGRCVWQSLCPSPPEAPHELFSKRISLFTWAMMASRVPGCPGCVGRFQCSEMSM